MHRGVQSQGVWLAGGALEPGWPHARSVAGPVSWETRFVSVSPRPGSRELLSAHLVVQSRESKSIQVCTNS
jgi:hypothetical protein